jgi:uncharacterized protein YjbJ (UPF0337 family)
MNWDRIEGNWKQFKGQVKEQWGKFTDDELDVVAGKRDQFLGKLQEKYGITKDEAQRQLLEFEKNCKDVSSGRHDKITRTPSKTRTRALPVRPFV